MPAFFATLRVSLPLRLMSGTALALCSSAALAQNVPDGTVLLDPIIMQSRDIDGNAADRGTSEYVADAELERARMGDLRDLFSGIASVSVGGAIPIAQKIFVNGVDMLNLAITVDGVSQNNRIFHHVSANAFDPGLMKFVRVDAGTAAADAGPNALAGAVVMETVDAADVIADDRNIGGNVRLSYDDNGETFGRSATLAGRHAGFEWLGYLKSATGEDYETGAGPVMAGTAADMQTAMLKLAWEAPEGHRFELSALQMDDDTLRPYRANIGEVIGGRPVPPLRRYDTTRSTWSFSYENTQAAGFWDPSVTIGYSEVDVRVDQPVFPTVGRSDGKSDTLSGKIENRFHLSGTDTVTAGIDFYERSSRYRDALTAGLEESADNIGLYTQARLEPMDRLAVSFGLRFDMQDFTGVNGWTKSVSGASGNASVAWDVTDSLTLRGGVSSVFGGIGLEDNFIFDTISSYEGLKAARSRNYSLGFDYDAGALRFDGEIFVTEIDNARGVTSGTASNFGFESRGYNLGSTWGWDGGFLRASYSYSRVKLDGANGTSYDVQDYGTPLGGVFALEVQHNPLDSAFTWGGSLQAAQAYDHLYNDADRTLPGYAVLNLFGEWASPSVEGLTIRAAINNVFDKDYSDRATYGGDFSSVSQLREPGRTVSLVAAMKF